MMFSFFSSSSSSSSLQSTHTFEGTKKKLLEGGDGLSLAGLSDVADSFYDSDIGEN